MSYTAAVYLFSVGVASSLATCPAVCLPVVSAYLMSRQENSLRGMYSAAVLGASRMMGLGLVGALGGSLGKAAISFMNQASGFLLPGVGILLVALGLLILSGREPHRLLCPRFLPHTGRRWLDLLILGLLMAFVPCATHLAVLAYISMMANNWLGGAALGMSFGAGGMLVIPVAGYLTGGISSFLHRSGWAYAMRLVCGGLLVLAGAWQVVG
jgi:cytochrome c biogenesis protein CcdA